MKISNAPHFTKNTSTTRLFSHVKEDQLLPAGRCPFCASTYRKPVTLLQSDPEVLLLKCLNCYALSASRMPTNQYLRELYSYFYDGMDAGIALYNPIGYARYLCRIISSSHPQTPALDILDFGGGNGEFSYMISQLLLAHGVQKITIAVIDISPNQPIPSTHNIIVEKYATLEDVVERRFDVAIASAVIEHLPDARAVTRQLLGQLKPGGILYARTPFWEGFIPIFRMLGVQLNLMYPLHLHDLGAGFWNNLLIKVFPEFRNDYRLVRSQPSKVGTTFRKAPLWTFMAHVLKCGYYVFGSKYTLVGGWEVIIQRKNHSDLE